MTYRTGIDDLQGTMKLSELIGELQRLQNGLVGTDPKVAFTWEGVLRRCAPDYVALETVDGEPVVILDADEGLHLF